MSDEGEAEEELGANESSDVQEEHKNALKDVDQTLVPAVDLEHYRPLISSDHSWILSELDLGKQFVCT